MTEKWRTFRVVHDWNDFEFTIKLKDYDLTKQLCKEMIDFFDYDELVEDDILLSFSQFIGPEIYAMFIEGCGVSWFENWFDDKEGYHPLTECNGFVLLDISGQDCFYDSDYSSQEIVVD